MTATNQQMTSEQLADLSTLAVQLQTKAEANGDRDTAVMAYAVQKACAELIESRREFTAANATIHNLELNKAELAAELSAIEAIHNDAVFITDEHYEQCPPEAQKIIGALAVLRIPAYDAYLAEVLAHVWIEGSEPEEFGRYWVRYETDVGPQYCSAKWMEHNFCAGSDTNIHKIWLADHSRSMNSLRGVTHYTKLPESLEAIAAQLRQGAEYE